MSVNERIKFIIDSKENGKQSAFAHKVGVSPTVIGTFMPPKNKDGRVSKPGFEVLNKIAVAYPELRIEWLITGEGEPFKIPDGTMRVNNVDDSRTLNKNTASGNTVSYGSVPTPPDTSELGYLRTRVRELEQKNNDLLDKLMQVLTK